MNPKIIVISDGKRSEHTLKGDVLTIGRSGGVDVRLDDRLASRAHCRIERMGDTFVVRDEGSQNGTFVNGSQILSGVLSPGDQIRVGTTQIYFEREPDQKSFTQTMVVDRPAAPDDLVAQLTKERSNLLRLQRINRMISGERDLGTLLRLIVDSVIELTGAERGFLITYHGDNAVFEVARHFEEGEVKEPELAISRSLAEEVRRSGKAVISINAREDDRFKAIQSISNLGLRSVLAVPFKVHDEVVGAVYVDNRLAKGVFNEDDQALVEAFTDQAAIGIKQAMLMQELKEANAQLKQANDRAQSLAEELKKRVAVQEVELAEARARLRASEHPRSGAHDYSRIIGRSAAMQDVFKLLDRLVESEFPVLIHGESGTGKDLIAHAIHDNSARRGHRFVSENCAALPDALLESELFGYEKGAFTGAVTAKKGLLEVADRGTLFLDEVGDMSQEMQKKLLRVLQDGEFRRVGGREPIRVDVRVISASNKELGQLVEQGTFRQDLYYRLNVLPVTVPSLRRRVDDIPLLIDYFLRRFAAEMGVPRKTVRPEVLDVMVRYPWPGNVRELENEVRRLITLGDDPIGIETVSERVRMGAALAGREDVPEGQDLTSKVEAIERREIKRALREAGRNKSRAADLLGISRFTLQRKMDKYGMSSEGTDA